MPSPYDNPMFKIHSGAHPLGETEASQVADKLHRDNPQGIPSGVCFQDGAYSVVRLDTGKTKYRYQVRKDGQPVNGIPVQTRLRDALSVIDECLALDRDV